MLGRHSMIRCAYVRRLLLVTASHHIHQVFRHMYIPLTLSRTLYILFMSTLVRRSGNGDVRFLWRQWV